MVTIQFSLSFQKFFSKIKSPLLKRKLIKRLAKLKDNPELGKPMMYARKGTRELYIKPFRLSYAYMKEEDRIILLDLYHKDSQ